MSAVVGERAHKAEVILATFQASGTGDWLAWAVQFEQQATHVGYQHLLLLGADEESCLELQSYYHDKARSLARFWPGCVWASLPGGGAASYERGLGVWALWLRRYHAASLLLAAGLNVLLCDLDVVFSRDFYEEVQAPPFDVFNLFTMPNEINGGLWYAREAHPDGPLLYLLRELVARGELLFRYRAAHAEAAEKLPPRVSDMDQFLFAELLSTLAKNESRWLWPSLMEASAELPNYLPGGGEAHSWPWVEMKTPRRPLPVVHDAGAQLMRRIEAWNDHDRDVLYTFDIRLPPELRGGRGGGVVERVVRAPDFLFDGEQSILMGWNSPGWLRPAYAAVTHLVATGHAYVGRPSNTPAARMQFLMAHGYWRGPTPATPTSLLSLGMEVVLAAALAGEAAMRRLIDGLLRLAGHLGRTPIMPFFPCRAAEWLPRSKRAAHGFTPPADCAWSVAMEMDPMRWTLDPSQAVQVPTCAPYLSSGECALGDVWYQCVRAIGSRGGPAHRPRSAAATCPTTTPRRRRGRVWRWRRYRCCG